MMYSPIKIGLFISFTAGCFHYGWLPFIAVVVVGTILNIIDPDEESEKEKTK